MEEQENAGVKAALTSLYRLYAVYNITEQAGDFLEVCKIVALRLTYVGYLCGTFVVTERVLERATAGDASRSMSRFAC